MSHRSRLPSFIASILGGASPLLLAPAWSPAATLAASPDAGTLQEVIVTAQRREQNQQDVGMPITSIGTPGLKMLGHQDLTALAQQVPGLQVEQYSPTVTVLNIRGVSQNDFSDSQEAPIAFYNDGVYVSALGAISGQDFDLQRVEVDEGPQSTLFGRNATGGVIQVITAKPTKRFEGYAGLTGGSYGEIGSDAAISGPLTRGGNLLGRLAVSTDHFNGYQVNLIGPNRGGRNFYAARGQLEALLGNGGKLLLKVEMLRNNHEISGAYTNVPAGYSQVTGLGYPLAPNEDFWTPLNLQNFLPPSCPGCTEFGYKPPANPFLGSEDYQGLFDRRYWNYVVRYEQDLGWSQLTSISDYQTLQKSYGEDSDVSPLPLLTTTSYQNLYQYSEELRLAGQTQRLNWLGGLYALRIHSHDGYGNGLNDPGLAAPPPYGFGTPLITGMYGGNLDTKNVSAFAQGDFKLTSIFSAIIGARYTVDWKDYSYTNTINGFTNIVFTPALYPGLASRRFSNYAGKVELDAKPAHGVLLYASANRGVKSGGFGVPTLAFGPIDPQTMTFNQEVLIDYEGGAKLTLFGNRMTFDTDAFHYDYHNYQAWEEVGLSQIITNHPASVTGAELQIAARPTDNLTLSIFDTTLFTARAEGIVLPFGEITPRTMPQAPRWSAGGSIAYRVPVSFGVFDLSTNWKYNSGQYFSIFNAPIDYEHPYATGNVRLSFTPESGNWDVAFFVNNVANRYYRVFDFDLSQYFGTGQSTFAPPRWFGGTVTYHFGD